MHGSVASVVVVGLLLVYSSALAENFNPRKVNYIDRSTNGINWLFRGNEPKNSSNDFVYTELVSVMQQAAQTQANATLPSAFYLMDLSFENIDEIEDIIIEKGYFAQYPKLGNFTNWVIIGDLTGPDSYPPVLVEARAKSLPDWQLDQLPERMIKLKQILNSPGPNGLPVVIYLHCEAGSDRTGEVSGAYYLTYLNYKSFADVMVVDDKIAGRAMKNTSAFALQWYCYYLQYARNYTIDCSKAGF